MELIAKDATLKATVKDVQKQMDTLLVVIVLLPNVINQAAKTTLSHTKNA